MNHDPTAALGDRALQKWRELFPILVARGLMAEERDLLASYCEAFESWEHASEQVREEGSVSVSRTKGGSTEIVSPWVTIREQAANRMAGLARTLGIDASIRNQVADLSRYYLNATHVEDDLEGFGPPPDEEEDDSQVEAQDPTGR